MIRYKKSILKELKMQGYTTCRLRQERILGESTLQRLRTGGTGIRLDSLNVVCDILRCQPGDLLEWIPDEEKKQ